MEGECFWVNPREDKKVSESKMSESNMIEFKMAAIIKLSQNEWVKVFFCANGGNQSWQVWVSLRGKTKVAESKMAKFMASWRMNEFESECQVEWECFWVNLREENKVSESNMVEFKMAAIIKLSQNDWVKVFLCKWWEPILASVSEFERKN